MKEKVELRNSYVDQMGKLLNTVKEENRVFTDEENQKFEDYEKKVENIDNLLKKEEVLNRMDLREVKEEVKNVENNDVKVFENYIRGIVNEDKPTTKTDGQVTIPTTIASKIIDKVVEISPIYQMSERYNITGNLSLPRYDEEHSSIEMTYAEEGSGADSGEAKFTTIELKGYLGRCLAKVSKSLINNSKFDIVQFVINKMAQAIAVFIEKELLNGTDEKIEGLRGVTLSVKTATPSAITSDELIDTQEKVLDNFQANSIWIMNRETRKAIRKLKDNDGNYLLNRDLSSKWGYTLLGKDVYTSDAMSKLGTTGKTIAYYGDFSGLAVKISEEANMQILREKYAEQHMDGILAFIELDSKVQDTQKISKLTI